MRYLLLIILAAALFFNGCRKNPYQDTLPESDLDLRIKRLEIDLFDIDLNNIGEKIPEMYAEYGAFFDLYNLNVINIGSALQVTYPEYLTVFLTDFLNNEVYRETVRIFPELREVEDQLTEAFKRFHYYFPEKQIPALYSFISRFNQSIVLGDSILAIGLDKYLGSDCEYYKRLGLHDYVTKNMHPGKVVSDAVSAWCLTEFLYNDSVDNVLSNMIFMGKNWYLTKNLLPDHPDHLIAGFTEQELMFCEQNEARMWEFLIENKILFQSDRLTIQKYTGRGPFTKEFSTESPARAAIWIGWQIIEDYASRNRGLSLEEIMEEEDINKILALSRYNP